MLQAFDAAHAAIKTLCQAQLDLRAKVGQPKWQDAGVQSEIDSRYASRFDALLGEHGLAGIALAEAEATAAELSGVTGNATEADMVRRVQVRAAISAIGEKRRNAAVKSAVEAQFREALRELSDAEQDSKELKSAKRSALYARIETELQLPFPSRVDGRLDSLARSYARSAADSVYKQIVREKIAIEKRRPDGRAANEIRPIATEVGVTPAHARLGALHPRPDPGADARHAGHGQGRAAHRRPLAGHEEALHPPLQLPAVLGRGDGLHARPEAPRHRPRRARRARTRAGHPGRRDVPVHDARGLRDPGVQRLLARWRRCAARRWR